MSSASSPSDNSNVELLKLNDDCLYEICDCLSLKDLISMAQVCKRMHVVASVFFHHNFKEAPMYIRDKGVCIAHSDINGVDMKRIKTSIFNKVVTRISHYYDGKAQLEPFQGHSDEFESINRFVIFSGISDDQGEYFEQELKHFEQFLPKIETLEIRKCVINKFKIILEKCTNLKRLIVQDAAVYSLIEKVKEHHRPHCYPHNWLECQYPKLEHFEFLLKNPIKVKEFSTFFEMNKIHTFSTSIVLLWENESFFKNVKLDTLKIKEYD